jgi:hypothetical protein
MALQSIVDGFSVLRGRLQVDRNPCYRDEEVLLRALAQRGESPELDERVLVHLEICASQWDDLAADLPISERLTIRALTRVTRTLVGSARIRRRILVAR